MQQRLMRTELILGENSVKRLQNSHVLIVGLGGVGGYTLEALARTGVGNFTLIDADKFDETNLNRQILCTVDTIGHFKTLAAKDRLSIIDKEINVQTQELFINSENLTDVFKIKYDLVIDAIDSVDSKCALLTYCYNNNIRIVSSMGAGFRKDPTKIRTSTLSNAFGDPLAKAVRKTISAEIDTGRIPCVFSTEPPAKHDYKTIASLASVTGVMGLSLAQLAIDNLLS